MSDEEARNAATMERLELAFMPGEALPLFARREGVNVVVLSMEAYGDLLKDRGAAMRETFRAAKAPPAGLSTIERDAEVAEFLRDRFRGRETIVALQAACLAAFGAERTPSQNRIQTFRARWKDYR